MLLSRVLQEDASKPPDGVGRKDFRNTAIQLPSLYISTDDLQRERGLTDAREARRLATNMRPQALACGAYVM